MQIKACPGGCEHQVMQDLICAYRCDGVLQMAIPSAEVSLIFEQEEEWEGVGNRDRFLAGCWWACVIAD